MAAVMPNKKRKRPFALVILCLLLLLQAAGFALVVVGLALDAQYSDAVALIPKLGYGAMIIWVAIFAMLYLIASIGMWLLRPFSWRLTMILTGARMMVDLWVYFSGSPGNHLSMLFSIFTVFYLVQTDVRNLFETGRNREDSR